MRTLAAMVLLLCIAAGGTAAYYLLHVVRAPHPIGEPVSLRIPPGSSLREIDSRLVDMGLSPFPHAFALLARLHKADKDLKAGNYLLEPPGASLEQLLEKLASGDVVSEKFTIIEGETFVSVIGKIRANPMFKHTLQGDSIEEIGRGIGVEREHPEGLLYPDTYFFQEGTADAGLLAAAHRNMKEFLESEWGSRQEGLPFESPYEALVFASIVEKEAASLEEMPVIASVFINRLRKGMRLQADPTVIYGMGDSYNGNITKKDLQTDTPYNTYTRAGLPPTPIALPGPSAIRAALNPSDTDYLYFVATRDGSQHLFSKTLREHVNAVNKHQK